MEKHKPSDEILKELDDILSKINAMEIVASDDYQKNSIKRTNAATKILRALRRKVSSAT